MTILKNIVCLLLGLGFVLPVVQAQEVRDSLGAHENTMPEEHVEDLFTEAVSAYKAEDYVRALELMQVYSRRAEWHTGMGYWKAVIIDKNILYDDISDPLFIDLTQTVNTVLNEANNVSKDNRALYDEHYQELILIDEKINFAILKLRWNNDASYQEAQKEYQRKNYGVAVLRAETAVKSNNGNAYLMLGQVYENGYTDGKKDYTKAMQNYQLAFLAGCYDAAYHIGYLYYHGYGTVKNINQAFHWCQIAAKYRYIPAMKELSNMYKLGLGVMRNEEMAAYWSRMAAIGS